MQRYVKGFEEVYKKEIGKSSDGLFQSEYYNQIHGDDPSVPPMNVREYVALYFELEKSKMEHKKINTATVDKNL